MILQYTNKDGKKTTLRLNLHITGKTLTLGRSSDADIQIDDDKSSRIHSALRSWDDMYLVRDMNSSNGTYVNGKKIRVAELRPGDIIRIGQKEFTFEAEGRRGDVTVLSE